MDSIPDMPLHDFQPHPMPSLAIAPRPRASASPPRAPATRKAAFWDRIARKYAADPIADMAGYERTLQRVKSFLSADQSVLEIGCGTGTTALRLAPSTGRLLATDVSAGMIAIAREKLAAQPVAQLTFAVADAEAPVPGEDEYDVVLAFNVLHLVSGLDHALELAVQALRPGGLLICKTPCIAEMNPLVRHVALPLMRLIGKAPPVLCFDGQELVSAIAWQGMEILAVERHGSRGKDIRVFIVARRPG